MATLTVFIPDERMQQLRELAARFSLKPEELVRATVEEIVSQPEVEFRRALEYVLNKNAELYQRLA